MVSLNKVFLTLTRQQQNNQVLDINMYTLCRRPYSFDKGAQSATGRLLVLSENTTMNINVKRVVVNNFMLMDLREIINM